MKCRDSFNFKQNMEDIFGTKLMLRYFNSQQTLFV